ncbi:unnamed protein product [Ambrosiozyma monospora]|uniref:Unnamed protein product n=1 Tax=Ambrosiozyma monospora TaxID=43982 RepID=A0ACB5TLC6_AMBMO|nr:unnamed protein product [Ambrosiozyma monospora]
MTNTASIYDLPLEVWSLITSYLEPKDVFHLMLTNKTVFRLLRSNYIWKNLVYHRWFDNAYTPNLPKMDSYLEYFGYRNTQDEQLQKLIEKVLSLCSYNDQNEWQDLIDQTKIIWKNPDNFIPKLHSMSQHLDEKCRLATTTTGEGEGGGFYDAELVKNHFKSRLSEQKLKKLHIGSSMLESIRFQKLFATIYNAILLDKYPQNLEQMLLSLNHIDPHYYELLPARQRVINYVITEYRRTVDIVKDDYTSTERLIILIRFTDTKVLQWRHLWVTNRVQCHNRKHHSTTERLFPDRDQ